MPKNPEGRQLIAHLRQLDVELTRQRRTRLSIRAVWVAGLVLCIGMAARNWAGWQVSVLLLLLITVVCLLLGLVYAFAPAPGAISLARAFDREYALDAQLATALELNATGQLDGLTPLITDHARRRLAFISSDVAARVGGPLRLELQTLALVGVLAAGILLLGGLSSSLPSAPASDLSGLPQPADVEPPALAGAEPTPEAANDPGGERPASNPADPSGDDGQPLSAAGQQAADALSKALHDNGATRAAADALQQGNTAQAADELRKLADQADQLSPQSRRDIASALDRAAAELEADQPDLAERLRRDAEQLRGNDPASGLDDLARAIESLDQAQPQPSAGQPSDPNSGQDAPGESAPGEGTGSQPNQPENGGGGGAGNGAGGPGRTSPPPPATGAEVPLPPAPEVTGPTTPGQGNGNTTITLPGGEGSGSDASGGKGGSVPSDISDPATIPPELRDAIQNYFGR
jgi:hypothetical protein